MGEAARNLEPESRSDARTAPRAAVYASVDLHSEHNFWTGLTMNVSEGGLFVATHKFVAVGTRLTLNLTLPFEDAPLVIAAEVRWTRPYSGQDDVPPGLGLQFIDTDARALKKIKTFMSTMREPLFFEE